MKHLTCHLLAGTLMCCVPTLGLHAQELSGSATATGDYKAEFIPHSRLSGLPRHATMAIPKGTLPVAVDPVGVYQAPSIATMQGAKAYAAPDRYRGYLSLGAGSYLDASLSAGYRFIDNGNTTFGAWLQHSSTSLYRPQTANPGAQASRRKAYDQTIGLYGSHFFNGAGTLQAGMAYRLGLFNYYTSALATDGEPLEAHGQTLNDFGVNATWRGLRRERSFFVDGDFAYRYFGYRRFYLPYTEPSHGIKPPQENGLEIGATLGYDMADAGAVSLTARSQMMFYTNTNSCAGIIYDTPPAFTPPLQAIRNYGIVTLQPGYSLARGNWSLRAGLKADISWGVAGAEDFSTFHLAPDIALSYAQGKATVYLCGGGGVQPNTLASLSELDMYLSPALSATLPQYSPLNATLGLRLGDFNGFSAGVHMAYAITDNTPLSGWYPYWLANEPLDHAKAYDVLQTLSLKGFSLGADMQYKLGAVLDVKGALSYQRQSGEDGYFNGLDRPHWTIAASADVYPIKGLCVGVSYEYRGVRNLILAKNLGVPSAYGTDHNFNDNTHNFGYIRRRLPDIYDLGAHARYTLAGRYTFSLSADNLLGCDPALNPLMPEPGLRLTGGFSILF